MPLKDPALRQAYNAAYSADPEHHELARLRTIAWRNRTTAKYPGRLHAKRVSYQKTHKAILVAQTARRRALRNGAAISERIVLSILGERDGWTCGICHEPVDRTLRHPDPMSASHDHVVSLVKGGDHSYANSQLAHLVCNLRKKDR